MKLPIRFIVGAIIFLLLGCSPRQDKPIVDGLPQQQIAFASRRDGNLEIYVMDTDGKNQKNLTNNISDDLEPAWSPDGTQIAFSSYRDGNSEIYIMNSDGSGLMRLTNNLDTDLSPVWSPDGKSIAFISDRDKVSANQGGTKAELYIMERDGSNPVRITNDKNFYYELSWSPDGKRIAICSSRESHGTYLSNHIYIVNLEDFTQVAVPYYTRDDEHPVWSPDGRQLLIESTRDGSANIYIVNASSFKAIQLTKNSDYNITPSWSPNGTNIVFASRRYDNYDIYTMDVNGSNIVQLTDNPRDDYQPVWSPLP